MLWHGESHSTIFWSVKVSSLMDLLLSLFCQNGALSSLRPLFTPQFSRCSALHIILNCPRASLGGSRIYSSSQVHQIHLEIYLRRVTLAEIRGLIWAARADRVIPASSYSFIKPSTCWWLSPDCIPGLYLKMTKGADGFFLSLFLLSLLSHYFTEMNSADL